MLVYITDYPCNCIGPFFGQLQNIKSWFTKMVSYTRYIFTSNLKNAATLYIIY